MVAVEASPTTYLLTTCANSLDVISHNNCSHLRAIQEFLLILRKLLSRLSLANDAEESLKCSLILERQLGKPVIAKVRLSTNKNSGWVALVASWVVTGSIGSFDTVNVAAAVRRREGWATELLNQRDMAVLPMIFELSWRETWFTVGEDEDFERHVP